MKTSQALVLYSSLGALANQQMKILFCLSLIAKKEHLKLSALIKYLNHRKGRLSLACAAVCFIIIYQHLK